MSSLALPPAAPHLAALAYAFCERQGVELQRAAQYAEQLVQFADDDILQAALHWAATGEMSQMPEVCGRTPATMAQTLTPLQVFSGLAVLRMDPVRGEHLLGHGCNGRLRGVTGRLRGSQRATPAPSDDPRPASREAEVSPLRTVRQLDP